MSLRPRYLLLSILSFAISALSTRAAAINLISFASVSSNALVDFEDLPGGTTNHDGILSSGGVTFAERFVGQTLDTYTDGGYTFDNPSPFPSGPLALQAGLAGQNLATVDYPSAGNTVLAGLGVLGFPSVSAIGEGSLAMLFMEDQSEVGLRIIGGQIGGFGGLNFYARDGSYLGGKALFFDGVTEYFGFAREGGATDIAGILIYNADPNGIGLDDIKYTRTASIPGVPEGASTAWLLGLALAGPCLRRLHRRR